MKKTAILLCMLALALAACKPEPEPEPTPNNGGQNNDTTETVVKKYLVKEFYAEPDCPIREFTWNEDFSRIMHITTYKNNPYQLDYDFDYYGKDSMKVVISKPLDSWGLAFSTNYTCHFDEDERINRIDYYYNSSYQSTQMYHYDTQGRLVSVTDEQHNTGIRFEWNGENICATYSIPSEEQQNSFDDFTEYLHPEYNMPYLLPDCDSYHFWYLTEPLWRNWYNEFSNMKVECDEDGYVTCSYRIDEHGEKYAVTNYEYNQPKISQ